MKQYKEKGLSLFYRLLLVFLGTVIIVSGLLTVISYIFSKNSLEKHTQERITQEFVNLSHEFEHELKTVLIKELQILASNPVLDNFIMSSLIEKEINARSLERLFLQSITYTDSYESISVTRASHL